MSFRLPIGARSRLVPSTMRSSRHSGASSTTALRRELQGSGLDGIWLALHGAMVTTECADPEGELLGRIRAVPGADALPLFGAFDLHATFTAEMARHADALVAYRENPHTDARETAMRSAHLLKRALDTGVRPHMLSRTAPVIWPPTGTGTADRPMRDLEDLARRIEAQDPEIWAVNVIAGYSFSDVPDAGVSFSLVTTGSDESAEAALAQLVETADRSAGTRRPARVGPRRSPRRYRRAEAGTRDPRGAGRQHRGRRPGRLHRDPARVSAPQGSQRRGGDRRLARP